MRRMFGAKNIDKVQQTAFFPPQHLAIDEFCSLFDELKSLKAPKEVETKGSATKPPRRPADPPTPHTPLRPALKLPHFFDDNDEHPMLHIDRVSSSSIASTPTSSPAHDLVHGDSLTSSSLPAHSESCNTLSSSSTDSAQSYGTGPVVARRNPTIEKMLLDAAERSAQHTSNNRHSPKIKVMTPAHYASISPVQESGGGDRDQRFVAVFPSGRSNRGSANTSNGTAAAVSRAQRMTSAADLQARQMENSMKIAQAFGQPPP